MHSHFREEEAPWWKRSICQMGLCLAALLVTCALATQLKAFKIGFGSQPPIHERITAGAITSVMPQANPMFISNVQSGVYNTDLSHQPVAAFHFDKSTTTNGGFENGFAALHGMLAAAAWEAQICCDANGNFYINPLFLNPQHSTFRDLAEDIIGTYLDLSVNGSCLTELACPTDEFASGAASVQAEVLPILLDSDPDPDQVTAYNFQAPMGNNCCSVYVPNFADVVAEVKSKLDSLLSSHCRPEWSAWPPGSSPVCFDRLEDIAPDDNNFQLLAGHLRILQYEYQAYYAWQHLGHGFHTTQDFFAHSNYVELAAGYTGPPCAPGSSQAASLCGKPLDQATVPLAGILLPTDLAFPIDLSQFAEVFNTQTDPKTNIQWMAEALKRSQFQAAFADGNFNHLQTGYFPCPSDANSSVQSLPAQQGFLYCHTGTDALGSAPGMNKDEDYSSGGERNHLNHKWALESANRMSVILFWSFMNSVPNGNSYLVTPDSVLLAANPMHLPIAPSPSSTVYSANIPHINRNFPGTIESPAIQSRNSMPQPTAQASRSGAPGNLPSPQWQQLSKQSAPRLAMAGRPAVPHSLPPITRPELLRPNPQPHIFVKTFPNRAFRLGERVTLRVDAFDAKTGAQLHDLPVVIGSVRGLTSRPIPLTIAATTTQRCGAIAGQRFCLNDEALPMGKVVVPRDRYPGGGGNFTLSVVSPKLLTGVARGPIIRPEASFTVTALDAHTHRPVPGAEVFLGQTRIGQANQPISYHVPALMPIRVRNRMGTVQTVAASLGPPMIVRAPGYSDRFVRYVLSNVAP